MDLQSTRAVKINIKLTVIPIMGCTLCQYPGNHSADLPGWNVLGCQWRNISELEQVKYITDRFIQPFSRGIDCLDSFSKELGLVRILKGKQCRKVDNTIQWSITFMFEQQDKIIKRLNKPGIDKALNML